MTFGTCQKVTAFTVRVTAASATMLVLLATGILNDLPGLTSCHCDNIGLVSLAGNYVFYITVLCVQGIPILSLLIFMPSLYSHSNLKNFYIYCR